MKTLLAGALYIVTLVIVLCYMLGEAAFKAVASN